MLYEFALMPDIFDPPYISSDKAAEVTLITLLRGLADDGLVANLNKGRWLEHISVLMDQMPQGLKSKVQDCLKILDNRHRLVRHPRRVAGDPTNELEWLDLALQSHPNVQFSGILLTQPLIDLFGSTCSPFIEFSDALDSPVWRNRKQSIDIVQSTAEYRCQLAPVLRHAKKVSLVDPYMSCRENRFLDTISLCDELLGQRGFARSDGQIHIHAGDPTNSKFNNVEPVADRLEAWQAALGPIVATSPHRYKVFLWGRGPTDREPHDRYILTDQCGVFVGRGLDSYSTTTITTTWARVDNGTRETQHLNYDKVTSPFRFLGERDIVLDK